MRKASVLLLQAVVALVGLGALVFLLLEPLSEGRNTDATLFEVYFRDPFLACAYAASVLFFVALYRIFALLGHVRRGTASVAVRSASLRIIRYCALALVGLVAIAEIYLFAVVRGTDDIAGGVAMGLIMIIVFAAAAAIAGMSERRLGGR